MTTYGIFSTVYEPEKFPDPEPILRFNRETVLLCNAGTHARVLESGCSREIVISISHYGWAADSRRPTDLDRDRRRSGPATGQYRAYRGRNGARSNRSPPSRSVRSISKRLADEVCLNVALESETCRQENGWDFWVFPAKRPGFDPKSVVNRTSIDALNARYDVAPDASLDTAQLVLADRVTPEVLDYLREGGPRVAFAPKEGRPGSFPRLFVLAAVDSQHGYRHRRPPGSPRFPPTTASAPTSSSACSIRMQSRWAKRAPSNW